MTPEQILSVPPRVLKQSQREFYFAEGYLLLEKAIDEAWIARLRAATDELVERGRKVTVSDTVFDLEPGHRADAHGCGACRTRSSSIPPTGSTASTRRCRTSSPTWSGPM